MVILNLPRLIPFAFTFISPPLALIANQFGFSIDVAFKELPTVYQDIILYGSGDQVVEMIYDDGVRSYKTRKPFEGILPSLTRRYKETDSNWVREELEKYRTVKSCELCNGKRLKTESLHFKIGGKNISDLGMMDIRELAEWFENVQLNERQIKIAEKNPLYVIEINSNKNEIIVGPKEKLVKREIELRDINILVDKEEFNTEIFVKIRSTGKLIKSKLSFVNNKGNVELLDNEYGISPGQACVFYKKDQYGDKLLGGGWIVN